MRSTARIVFLALWAASLSGCVSGNKIRANGEVIQADIARARKSGAYRCAPRELALAEANLDFAYGEVSEGNSTRAHDHIVIAEENVKKALVLSRDCGPKQVLIKESKPLVVKIEPTDRDGDGIPDDLDRCPDVPEDFDGFQDEDGCPDLDNDNDGIVDTLDACPNTPGPVENHGCPILDRDGDGIPDWADACPDQAGPPNADPTKNGCPDLDRDHDGIPNDVDACPDEPGVPDPDPKKNGCPRKMSLVVVKKDKIEIKQQINFEFAKATIKGAQSFKILDEVVLVLKDYPGIKKVKVEGHTDSVGPAAMNLKLSQARAESVVKYLTSKGVDPERLEAVGYGLTRPIASNATEKGRAQNRRTEFNIAERD
jgi:outer membrane protein OmpA-like peptidoglycan-associated protein